MAKDTTIGVGLGEAGGGFGVLKKYITASK